GSHPAWGAWWSSGDLRLNGWGESWWYWEDPAPHFPNVASSVLIPAGVSVDTYGGGQAYCGSLTLGTGALLQSPYANIIIGGPALVNDGTIELTGGGGTYGGFEVNGPIAISGEGMILLAPGRFFTWSPPMVLTIGSGQFIHGTGQFGSLPYGNYHGVDLVNHGHIQATSTTSALDIYGMDVANDGTAEATGGATLRIWGDWDNSGGELLASDGGVIYLCYRAEHAARIRGGTLRTSGGGEIRPLGGGPSVESVTIDGTFHVLPYESTHMAGAITNLGTINNEWNAIIKVDSTLTFAGMGTMLMGDGSYFRMREWPAQNARVTNGPEHMIECYGGRFGSPPDYYNGDRRIELLNEGTLRVFSSSNPTAFRVTGAGFENRGELIFEPAPNVNAGIWGKFRQTAGRLVTNDGFISYDSAFTFSGGLLTGNGYLQGAVTLGDSAAVNPGAEDAAGTLNIWGPMSLTDGATLVSQWSRNAQDLLRVNGLLTATGALTVRVVSLGSGPMTPADYTVLRANSRNDQATWVLELPAGWSSSGLEWVGNDLVVRGLTRKAAILLAPPVATHLRAAPNPFNPSTTIEFVNPADGQVDLWVSDVRGRRVRTLLDGFHRAGERSVRWDGLDDQSRPVGSGAYFCVLDASGERRTIRLTIIR
ncbi:MAG: hypothetical protein FJY73_09165, partial [Candidatus Eisenbacteria bacterium]|nr:hypothetical protein [Candidatus Eisenbacteria bacterium]